MKADVVKLRLPWPPSTNRYWRHVGNRTLISAAGRAYKKNVCAAVLEQLGVPVLAMQGAVAVKVDLYPPDKRRRDIDNHAGKSLLDALEYSGLLEDDSQIKELHAVMCSPEKGGWCEVELCRLMETDQ